MKKLLIVFIALCISLTLFSQYTATDTLSYTSRYFKNRRKLKVSLPEEYAINPDKKYNVIYLFDAQSSALFDYTKATLSILFPNKFDVSILVGIEGENRFFEFLPKFLNTGPDPKDYLRNSAGGADTLALSIENELKPLIEKTYRTSGFNIGIGHSLGGTFVTYSMLKFPKIFNAGICVSPNYIFDKEAILSLYKDAEKRNNLSHKLLYIGFGKGDETEDRFRESIIKFGNLLNQNKTANLYFKIDSLNNNSHYLTPLEGFFKGLVFINDFMTLPYEKYKPELDKNNPENFIHYVKKYFEVQSSKTGVLLPSINELNSMAYIVFYAGRKKEAILLLDWALSLYPDNINLYDSMGEMQEGSGDIEKAKLYYSKGRSVAETQKDKLSQNQYKHLKNWFQKRLEKLK